MSALCEARNSLTFSAPLSVKVITCQSPSEVQCFTKCSESADLATLHIVPTTDELKQRIERRSRAQADVVDLNGGGDHFRATVIAPEFAGLSRIEQHRRVYAVFGAEIGGPIHALSLVTRAEA